MCAGFDDAELLARIRGQTRDLPISLISAPDANVTQPSALQLLTIARQYNAEFVVSVDRAPGVARVVYVFDALSSELRVRNAPAPDRKHRFARSAAAETVALIVRGELSDALAARAERQKNAENRSSAAPATGGTSDAVSASAPAPLERASQRNDAQATPKSATQPTPVERAEPQRKPVEEPRPQSPPRAEKAAPEDAEEPEPAEAESTGSWLDNSQLSLELAGRVSSVIDQRYFLGGALSLRWTVRYVSLGIIGSTTLADRAQRQGLTLTLHEHSVGLEVLAHLPLPAAFSAGLGAAGRLSFYGRSASSRDPSWQPQPAETSTTVALGPIVELRWQLHQHLGVAIRLGLDVLLRPISFRYRLDTNTSVPAELERQNRLEPWLSLGVFGSL